MVVVLGTSVTYCCGILNTVFNCCSLGIFMFEECGVLYRILSFRTRLLVADFSCSVVNGVLAYSS